MDMPAMTSADLEARVKRGETIERAEMAGQTLTGAKLARAKLPRADFELGMAGVSSEPPGERKSA